MSLAKIAKEKKEKQMRYTFAPGMKPYGDDMVVKSKWNPSDKDKEYTRSRIHYTLHHNKPRLTAEGKEMLDLHNKGHVGLDDAIWHPRFISSSLGKTASFYKEATKVKTAVYERMHEKFLDHLYNKNPELADKYFGAKGFLREDPTPEFYKEIGPHYRKWVKDYVKQESNYIKDMYKKKHKLDKDLTWEQNRNIHGTIGGSLYHLLGNTKNPFSGMPPQKLSPYIKKELKYIDKVKDVKNMYRNWDEM